MRYSLTPAVLREIVEAVLEVPILATAAGRDAVLMLLRPELAAAIPRMPTARLDTISIVSNREFLDVMRIRPEPPDGR